MSFYKELEARGIIHQVTDPTLAKHLESGPVTLYCGFDPSGDSLHVGSLFPLITLRRFQEAGHKPIVVLGGATGMIGDPSGKSAERNLLTDEQVQKNTLGLKRDASKFVKFTGPSAGIMVNNSDFYKGLTIIDFLREVGKHFTVNYMITKDSVNSRMNDRDQGISYTEFSYMLLQSYDFYELNKQHGCTLQIGASDQWGNITAGCELIRRKHAHEASANETSPQTPTVAAEKPAHVFGMTHHLVTKSDGGKFGKTETGTIWLDPNKTSPYEFYQFFLQTPDDKVIQWIKWFTFLTLEEIAQIEIEHAKNPAGKTAHKTLASELTKLVHGEEALKTSLAVTNALFGEEIKNLTADQLKAAIQGAPQNSKTPAEFDAGIPLLDALVDAGLFASKGAAKKDIPAGGVYLNNERVTDIQKVIMTSDLLQSTGVLLRKGKKNYHWLVVQK